IVTWCHVRPPSWVAQSSAWPACAPHAQPSAPSANRSSFTLAVGGAGMPTQVCPPLMVRRTDVHGALVHGAVPSTKPSLAETKVTESAWNPAGTGPPSGRATGIGVDT